MKNVDIEPTQGMKFTQAAAPRKKLVSLRTGSQLSDTLPGTHSFHFNPPQHVLRLLGLDIAEKILIID